MYKKRIKYVRYHEIIGSFFQLELKEFVMFDREFGLYGSKSSPGTPPHVWKPPVWSQNNEKQVLKKLFLIRSGGYRFSYIFLWFSYNPLNGFTKNVFKTCF